MAQAEVAINILAKDKASAAFDQVSRSMGKAARAGSFVGTMAGNLAGQGFAAIKNFAAGSVDAFAAVEDATGAAGVQFGKSLPSVVKFAEQATKSFGLSKREALEAQNTFGTLGKVAGLSGSDLAGFAQNLTGLAGDMASFKGTTTEQAITAVGAALRGETEPIRAYGVLIDAAAVQAEAAAIGIAKPIKDLDKIKGLQLAAIERQRKYNEAVKEFGPNSLEAEKAQVALSVTQKKLSDAVDGSIPPLTAQQKVMATQSLILKQTKDAQGDFNRTMDSTANVAKRQAAATENAQVSLGEKLAPALTAARSASIKLIDGLTVLFAGITAGTAFVQEHSTAMTIVAGVVGAVVLPALVKLAVQYAVTGATAVASAAKQVASWLATQLGAYRSMVVTAVVFTGMVAGWVAMGVAAVANAAVVVAGWVLMGAQALLGAAKMAAAWLIAMGPIAIVIAAIAGVVFLIVKHWDTIKAATAKAWDWVVGKVKGVFDWMKNLFLNFTGPGLLIKHWDTIVATIKALPGRIKSAASGMWDGIKDAFRSALNWIIGKWNGLEFSIPGVSAFGKKIGGFTIGVPDIPMLAKGGIVTKPTLAMVGEAGPEAVIPLNRRGVGGGGAAVNITLQGEVFNARQIRAMLLRLQRETGVSIGIA